MSSPIQQALELLGERRDLPEGLMQRVMHQIMDGEAGDAQIGGLLMALKVSGEQVAHIREAATVMRQRATQVQVSQEHLIDTCGTGGDGLSLFNVSTAAAFIAAAGGARVAKHGNRSVSSSTGSADVLEQAGVPLQLEPQQVADCIDACGIGFLFAPAHHGATRHAVAARKQLGVRTLFNLLGPLTNPAGTRRQIMGVYSRRWLPMVAEVLQQLGSEHVMVVHSHDGMDEISLAAPTDVAELRDGQIREYTVRPEDFGVRSQSVESLVVNNAAESLQLIEQALRGAAGPAADLLALNAGAALYVAGIDPNLTSGVQHAQQLLASGAGWDALQQLKAHIHAHHS